MDKRALTAWAVMAAGGLQAQQLFEADPGGILHFNPSDSAVLSSGASRNDINCRVEALRPRLGFDFKYEAGYVMYVSASEVGEQGDSLRVLFRVKAKDGGLDPVYFQQVFEVEAASTDGGGTAVFPGRFLLGPGKYEVNWLMRNRKGRVCSSHWQMNAPKPGRAERLAAAAPANSIAPYRYDTFDAAPPVERDPEDDLHVAVLLNLAPLDRTRFKLSDYELDSVVGMLRSLHREPTFGLFSLIAFNAADRNLVYSAERTTQLDFEALGEALEATDAGVVDAAELADPESEQRFLAGILNQALGAHANAPDAVVVLGPKIDRDARIPEEMLEFAAEPGHLFQIIFHRTPHSYPWPGAIETALGPRGLKVYNATLPADFAAALEDLLGIVTGTPSRPTAPSAPASHAVLTQTSQP